MGNKILLYTMLPYMSAASKFTSQDTVRVTSDQQEQLSILQNLQDIWYQSINTKRQTVVLLSNTDLL